MLTTVLLLATSVLSVRGETACPSVTDVLLELEKDQSRGPVEGVVELEGDHLWLHGGDGAMKKVAKVSEGTCEERAQEAARIVREWEELPPQTQLTIAEQRILLDDQTGRGARFLGTTLGAAVGAAIPVVLTFLLPAGSRGPALVGLELLGGVPVLALTALIGHYLGGGRGHYGWAILGAAVGVAGACALLFIENTAGGDWASPREPWRMGLAGLVATAMPVLTLEASDTMNRRQFGATIVPVNGGAGVSVGGRF